MIKTMIFLLFFMRKMHSRNFCIRFSKLINFTIEICFGKCSQRCKIFKFLLTSKFASIKCLSQAIESQIEFRFKSFNCYKFYLDSVMNIRKKKVDNDKKETFIE